MNNSLHYSCKILLVLAFLCCPCFVFAQDAPSAQSGGSAAQVSEEDSLGFFSGSGDTAQETATEQTTSGVWVFVRMILVLAIIIAAIYLLFRFMRKSMGVEPKTEDDIFLRKVSFISLGGAKSVQIVSLWNKAYILGVSDDNVTLLSEIDDKEMVDAMNRYADMNDTKKKPRSFEELLDIFTNRGAARGQEEQSARRTAKRGAHRKSAYDNETMNLINALKEKLTAGNKAASQDNASDGDAEAGDTQ